MITFTKTAQKNLEKDSIFILMYQNFLFFFTTNMNYFQNKKLL